MAEEELRYEWEEKLNQKGSLGQDHKKSSKSWGRILGFTLSVIEIQWRDFCRRVTWSDLHL